MNPTKLEEIRSQIEKVTNQQKELTKSLENRKRKVEAFERDLERLKAKMLKAGISPAEVFGKLSVLVLGLMFTSCGPGPSTLNDGLHPVAMFPGNWSGSMSIRTSIQGVMDTSTRAVVLTLRENDGGAVVFDQCASQGLPDATGSAPRELLTVNPNREPCTDETNLVPWSCRTSTTLETGTGTVVDGGLSLELHGLVTVLSCGNGKTYSGTVAAKFEGARLE